MPDAFLDSYDGQSTEELVALEGKYCIAISLESSDAISLEESYVLAVEGFEREVNNGGYRQFRWTVANQDRVRVGA